MQLRLQAASIADEPFLFSVYASTRAEEIAAVPWNDEQKNLFLQSQFRAQQQYYLERYPQASLSVIKLKNESIGRLYIAELADEIRIVDITVLPEFQKRGIGTKLVGDILKTGAETQKPVQIYIENFNPSAKFFAKFGFAPISEHGIHVLWCWKDF